MAFETEYSTRFAVDPAAAAAMGTDELRHHFHVAGLFEPGRISLTYTHYDRMIVGAAHPVSKELFLESYPNLRAQYFLERREIGIINVAGHGTVTADGKIYDLQKFDCLYIGKGVQEVKFSSKSSKNPAVFYLLSVPAHRTYPTTLMGINNAAKEDAGDSATANLRTINKYIHAEGIKSCQLVMGLTILHGGSVWNTMPPHVHDRRMEAYFYFDVPEGQRVFHYMGEGQQTRHILMKNHDAVVSPPWSIHSGVGTASYSFIWGMAGENLDYTDMDAIRIEDIR